MPSIHVKALLVLANQADNFIPLGDEHGIEATALRNAAAYIEELEALIHEAMEDEAGIYHVLGHDLFNKFKSVLNDDKARG